MLAALRVSRIVAGSIAAVLLATTAANSLFAIIPNVAPFLGSAAPLVAIVGWVLLVLSLAAIPFLRATPQERRNRHPMVKDR